MNTQMRPAQSARSVRAGRRTAVQVVNYTQPITNKPMDVVFVSAEASGAPACLPIGPTPVA